MKMKQLLLCVLTLVFALPTYASSGIFLRGEVSGWDALPEWEFVDEGNGVYTLSDKELSGEFKVADSSWGTCNYGASTSVSLGETYALAYNGNNLSCSETLQCAKIIFTLDADGNATLKLEGASAVMSGIFLRGEVNGWAALPEWEFVDEGEGVYTLANKELSGQFKIADADWGTHNYGASASVSLDEIYTLVHNGDNLSCSGTLQCSKITLVLTADVPITLKLEGTAEPTSGIFLRGDVNEWGALPEWEFIDEGNGVYKLFNKELSGQFKIADSTWGIYDYGIAAEEEFAVGKTCSLAAGSANLQLDNTYFCSEITLTIAEDGSATILIEGYIKGKPNQVYVIGNNNNWDFNDASGELLPTGNDGEYQGTVELKAADNDAVCYWRIYEGLGLIGSWGNPGGNTTEHTTLGTLEAGSEGCVTTNPGTYKVTFNINSGEFSAVADGGTGFDEAVTTNEFAFDVFDGVVRVYGEDVSNISIFSQNGMLLISAGGTNTVNASALGKNIYIIRISSQNKVRTYKVGF